jgi:hypothetical protein
VPYAFAAGEDQNTGAGVFVHDAASSRLLDALAVNIPSE